VVGGSRHKGPPVANVLRRIQTRGWPRYSYRRVAMIKSIGTMLPERADDELPARSAEASGIGRCEASLDRMLFALAAAGVPIGIVALQRLGRFGGLLLEAAMSALFVRAVAMVGAGTATRLRVISRVLLFAETAVDALATAAGFWAWVWRPFVRPVLMKPAGAHTVRRQVSMKREGATWVTPVAIAAWMSAMALHTARMAIYISPGRGLRKNRATGS
jgi:hypothetical protein